MRKLLVIVLIFVIGITPAFGMVYRDALVQTSDKIMNVSDKTELIAVPGATQDIAGHLAGVEPSLGDGSVVNPYQIASFENLIWISEDASRWDKHYVQTAYIGAAESVFLNENTGWMPIGYWTEQNIVPFVGSYDGQGYAIDSLCLYRPDSTCVGLFGYASHASLKNIMMINCDITGKDQVGAIAGWFDYDTLENCYSSGFVSGTSIVGGLVGGIGDTSAVPAIVRNCFSEATVSGNLGAGGLVGYSLHGSIINNCHSMGSVNGFHRAGGVLGFNLRATVNSCYSTAQINADGDHVGGLVGHNYYGTVNTSFWDTESSEKSTSEGGTGLTSSQMKNQTTYTDSGWNFTDVWTIAEDFNYGYPALRWYCYLVGIRDIAMSNDFILNNNYPNPFNPKTNISYELPNDMNVKLCVYDINGRMVASLVDRYQSEGQHKISWDASGQSSGVYFYRLKAGNHVETKKMVLLK